MDGLRELQEVMHGVVTASVEGHSVVTLSPTSTELSSTCVDRLGVVLSGDGHRVLKEVIHGVVYVFVDGHAVVKL